MIISGVWGFVAHLIIFWLLLLSYGYFFANFLRRGFFYSTFCFSFSETPFTGIGAAEHFLHFC